MSNKYKRFTKKRKLNGKTQVYNSDLEVWLYLDILLSDNNYDQEDYDYCDSLSFESETLSHELSESEQEKVSEDYQSEPVETVSSISEYESSDSGSCDSGGDSGD